MNREEMLQAALKGANLPVEIHLTKGYDSEVNVSLTGTLMGLITASQAVIEAIVKHLVKLSDKSFTTATILAYKKTIDDVFDKALLHNTSDDHEADLKSSDITEGNMDIYNSMTPSDMEKVLDAMFGHSKA